VYREREKERKKRIIYLIWGERGLGRKKEGMRDIKSQVSINTYL
jgi:hypothetical protein